MTANKRKVVIDRSNGRGVKERNDRNMMDALRGHWLDAKGVMSLELIAWDSDGDGRFGAADLLRAARGEGRVGNVAGAVQKPLFTSKGITPGATLLLIAPTRPGTTYHLRQERRTYALKASESELTLPKEVKPGKASLIRVVDGRASEPVHFLIVAR